MSNAVKDYYWKYFRSHINVNLTLYLANGTNTTNLTEAETIVYHIVMKKLISTPSASNIMATNPKVTVEKPSDI